MRKSADKRHYNDAAFLTGKLFDRYFKNVNGIYLYFKKAPQPGFFVFVLLYKGPGRRGQ
jgi:hypothetical protein